MYTSCIATAVPLYGPCTPPKSSKLDYRWAISASNWAETGCDFGVCQEEEEEARKTHVSSTLEKMLSVYLKKEAREEARAEAAERKAEEVTPHSTRYRNP